MDKQTNQLITKFFNCAEKVSVEWICSTLSIDPKTLFYDIKSIPFESTYRDIVDHICIEAEDGKYYRLVLRLGKYVPSEYKYNPAWKSDINFKKATSLLYDSINRVFPSVVRSILVDEKNIQSVVCKRYFENVFPFIDEEKMIFNLKAINHLGMIRNSYIQHIKQFEEKKDKLDNDELKTYENLLKQVKYISDEDIKNQEITCNVKNNELKNADVLHIYCYQVNEFESVNSLDNIFHKLPSVSSKQYVDEDSDDEFEKFKKENILDY